MKRTGIYQGTRKRGLSEPHADGIPIGMAGSY
jgi:hypothetical protein